MNPNSESPQLSLGLVVCGPCACGKSEVAAGLAKRFDVPFVDADSFHSEENIKKMSNGTPLTDQDRLPWLLRVRQEMIKEKQPSTTTHPFVTVVGACSALKKKYRDILRGTDANIKDPKDDGSLVTIFVFLKCSEAVLQHRLTQRQGHFMKANMLSSQLAALEIPQHEESSHAIVVNGDAELQSVLEEAVEKLGKLSSAIKLNVS